MPPRLIGSTALLAGIVAMVAAVPGIGIAAEAGGIAAEAGGIAAETGGIAAEAGGIAAEAGGIAAETGGIAAPGKDIAPAGASFAEPGRVIAGPAADPARAAFEEGLRIFDEAQAHAERRPTEREEAARLYRTAAERFVEAWRAGAASSEVFTNAANSFAFAGDVGTAVLFYRRALAVDPGNVRARTAIEYLRSRLPIRKPEAGTGTSILRSLFFWHDGLAFSTRRTAFLVLFPAAFACFAAAIWRRRPFRLLGFLLLAGGLALIGSLLIDALAGPLRNEAVIAVEVEGRRGGDLHYSPSHSAPFPPGTEVTVLEERASSAARGEPWLRVRLLDGKESWVPAGTVERVLP